MKKTKEKLSKQEEQKEVVIFKSDKDNYLKELSDKKNNTFRKIDLDDQRFKDLLAGECSKIKIINSETGEFFVRVIRDVTEYDGWVIITWEEER